MQVQTGKIIIIKEAEFLKAGKTQLMMSIRRNKTMTTRFKNKLILFSMLALSFLVSCDSSTPAPAAPADDDAWKQTEYISITKVEELKRIPELPDKKFILVEDLDLSSKGAWTPLCSMEKPFTGEFDGNGHTLTGLSVSGSGDTPLGLFAALKGASVYDLTLENVSVSCSGSPDHAVYAGPVAGYAQGSAISGCRTSGSVSVSSSGAGELSAGGIIGTAATRTLVTDCASSTDLYTRTDNSVSYTGGIAGSLGFQGSLSDGPLAAENTELPWDSGAQVPDIRDMVSACAIRNSLFNGTIRCEAAQLETGATSYCGGICGDGEQGRVTGCVVLAKSIRFGGTQLPVYSPLSNLSMADNCAILEELDSDAYEFADELLGQDTYHAAADAARLASGLLEEALDVDLGISQYIPKYITAADAGKSSTYTDLGWDLEDTWKMASGAPVPYEEQKPKILPGWYSYEKDSFNFTNYSDISPKGDILKLLFENAPARLIQYADEHGTGGYCYGCCITAAGLLNDLPEIGCVDKPDPETNERVPAKNLCDINNPTADRIDNKPEINENSSLIRIGKRSFTIEDYIELIHFSQYSADILKEEYSTTQDTKLVLDRVRTALENDEIKVPIIYTYPPELKKDGRIEWPGHIVLAVGLVGNTILVDDSNHSTLSRFEMTENGGWKYYDNLTTDNPATTSTTGVMRTTTDLSTGYEFLMHHDTKLTTDDDLSYKEMTGAPPDESTFFNPDDPNAVNPVSGRQSSAKLSASDILVHAEKGTVSFEGGAVIPFGPVLGVEDAETGSSVPLNMNPSGLYWATDAATVTVTGFNTTDGSSNSGNVSSGTTDGSSSDSSYDLNTVEIAGDNTLIKVRAADDASVTSTIFDDTINTVIDTAAGNPAEITVTTYADNAPAKSIRLSGTSADGSVRIVQTGEGKLRAAGMKDMKASATVMNLPGSAAPTAENAPAGADSSAAAQELSYDEQDALLEKLLAEHESSVPDSAPDKAAEITMDPDGNGVTAETDVPAPEIVHPDIPQNKDRSIYGDSGVSGACPICGKVHGSGMREHLTAKLHEIMYSFLKPFISFLPGNSEISPKLPQLPKIPEKDLSPQKWLENIDLTDRFRKMLKR